LINDLIITLVSCTAHGAEQGKTTGNLNIIKLKMEVLKIYIKMSSFNEVGR